MRVKRAPHTKVINQTKSNQHTFHPKLIRAKRAQFSHENSSRPNQDRLYPKLFPHARWRHNFERSWGIKLSTNSFYIEIVSASLHPPVKALCLSNFLPQRTSSTFGNFKTFLPVSYLSYFCHICVLPYLHFFARFGCLLSSHMWHICQIWHSCCGPRNIKRRPDFMAQWKPFSSEHSCKEITFF